MSAHRSKNQAVVQSTDADPSLELPDAQPWSIFDKRQKSLIVLIVTLVSTLATNIYFPALPTIAKDLGVSIALVNLSVTTYLIFQGLAPSIWGPLSDVQGRRLAYICTFVVFLAATIGLANTKNYATLITLRCLQSAGSASTVAIGAGAISDITTREERGGFMGIFQAGVLVPLAVGPVIGGALAAIGWRAIFWFLAIYSGVFLTILIVVLPETLRAVVANGSQLSSNPLIRYPLSIYQRTTHHRYSTASIPLPPRKKIDITGPLRILTSKQAGPIIIFLAIYYAIWQMSITALSSLLAARYHPTQLQLGLVYIPNGLGSMVGTFVSGKILDADYARVQAQFRRRSSSSQPADETTPLTTSNQRKPSASMGEFPLERARLRLVPLFAAAQCVSILVFGWTIHFSGRVHAAVPIASTFITGWTTVSAQSIVTTYLVDVFSDRSAAATASLNLARCLFAAGGTSVVAPILDRLGVGWGFSVCAAVQALAIALLAVQFRYGVVWRMEAEMERRKREGSSESVG